MNSQVKLPLYNLLQISRRTACVASNFRAAMGRKGCSSSKSSLPKGGVNTTRSDVSKSGRQEKVNLPEMQEDAIPHSVGLIHEFYPNVSLGTILEVYKQLGGDVDKVIDILDDGSPTYGTPRNDVSSPDNASAPPSDTESVSTTSRSDSLPTFSQQEAEVRLSSLLENFTLWIRGSPNVSSKYASGHPSTMNMHSPPPLAGQVPGRSGCPVGHHYVYKPINNAGDYDLCISDKFVEYMCYIISKFPDADPEFIAKKLISSKVDGHADEDSFSPSFELDKAISELWSEFPDLSLSTIKCFIAQEDYLDNKPAAMEKVRSLLAAAESSSGWPDQHSAPCPECCGTNMGTGRNYERSVETTKENFGNGNYAAPAPASCRCSDDHPWKIVHAKKKRSNKHGAVNLKRYYSRSANDCYGDAMRFFGRAMRELKRGGVTGRSAYEYYIRKSEEASSLCKAYRKLQWDMVLKTVPQLSDSFMIDLHGLSADSAISCVDNAIQKRELFHDNDERRRRAICIVTGSGLSRKVMGKLASIVGQHLLNSRYRVYLPPDNLGCIYILGTEKKMHNWQAPQCSV